MFDSWPEGLLSASAVTIQKKVFVFGGFTGQTVSSLLELTLPTDLCASITNKSLCVAAPACNWCEVSLINEGAGNTSRTLMSACFALSSPVPVLCKPQPNVTRISFQNGSLCDVAASRSRRCSSFQTCGACLVTYPGESGSVTVCKWCDGCSRGGKCLELNESCGVSNPCSGEIQLVKTEASLCLYGTGCEKDGNCPALCGVQRNCTLCLRSGG